MDRQSPHSAAHRDVPTSPGKGTWAGLLGATALLLLVPAGAAANPAATIYLWKHGLLAFALVSAFIVLAEGHLAARILGLPRRTAFTIIAVANAVSAVVGIPAILRFASLREPLVADMRQELHEFLGLKIQEYLVLFVLTVPTEAAVACWLVRWKGLTVTLQKCLRAMLLANLATYAALCPIEYMLDTPPDSGGLDWDVSRRIAPKSTSTVLATASDGSLEQVVLDGRIETVIDRRWKSACMTADLGFVAYSARIDASRDSLFWRDRRRGIEKTFPDLGDAPRAISPAGTRVAFVRYDGEEEDYGPVVVVLDTATSSVLEAKIPCESIRAIAWSEDESVFYVLKEIDRGDDVHSGTELDEVTLRSPGIATVRAVAADESIAVCDSLGPRRPRIAATMASAGQPPRIVGKDGGTTVSFALGPTTLWDFTRVAPYDLNLGRYIATKETTRLVVERDSACILDLNTRRELREAELLENGRYCVFVAEETLYLVDLETRRAELLDWEVLSVEPVGTDVNLDATARIRRWQETRTERRAEDR